MLFRIPFTGFNRNLFFFGLFLFVGALTVLIFLLIIDRNIFLSIFSVVAASLTGGRSAAILTGLEFKLPNTVISTVIFTINLAWLCTFFPLFVAFHRHLLDVRYIGKLLESTRKRAEREKKWLVKWGTWALPVFVWLPLPFTGSFAGAIIGFLMMIPLKKLMVLVILSMLLGVINWTWGFQYLMVITGTTGKIITWIVLLVIIFNTFIFNRRKNNIDKTKSIK